MPSDGKIIKGEANFNEAHITGESRPTHKSKGDTAIAGAICIDGTVEVKLSRVGAESTVGQIQSLIARAQATKPTAQTIADKASRLLTFTALTIALVTVAIWFLVLGKPFVFAITLAITVLVIACPHALGLAIPTVTTIATKLSVDNGIFVKDLSKLEVIRKADYVVFDKTGTLTRGSFGVSDVSADDFKPVSLNKSRRRQLKQAVLDVMKIAAAIEAKSSHVIAKAIAGLAQDFDLPPAKIDRFKSLSGKGVRAKVNGVLYYLGSPTLMEELGVMNTSAKRLFAKLSGQGKTVVFLANRKHIVGLIALADEIRPESLRAVEQLHQLGLKIAMLTGDNEATAATVARALKIDDYFAEILPEDKYKYIKKLQADGNVVIMVGDGINDAPALTQANVGVAIGAGTDVAVEAGDAVLTRDNPEDVAKLIRLARKVYRKMIENLIWAFGYNIFALPAAAGLFIGFGFKLSPGWGAILMSLSSVIVVINAMALKRARLAPAAAKAYNKHLR